MEISQTTRIVLEREELEDIHALAQYADNVLMYRRSDGTPEFEAAKRGLALLAKLFKFEARTP